MRTANSRKYRCNKASVDLEPGVRSGRSAVAADARFTGTSNATGSPRAKWILENWIAMLPKFVKVFPHEFKRVLKKRAAAETAMHQTDTPRL